MCPRTYIFRLKHLCSRQIHVREPPLLYTISIGGKHPHRRAFHRIGSDQYAIWKILGECKHNDFLYLKLTAREHLELHAGIRGVPAKDMADTVEEEHKW